MNVHVQNTNTEIILYCTDNGYFKHVCIWLHVCRSTCTY